MSGPSRGQVPWRKRGLIFGRSSMRKRFFPPPPHTAAWRRPSPPTTNRLAGAATWLCPRHIRPPENGRPWRRDAALRVQRAVPERRVQQRRNHGGVMPPAAQERHAGYEVPLAAECTSSKDLLDHELLHGVVAEGKHPHGCDRKRITTCSIDVHAQTRRPGDMYTPPTADMSVAAHKNVHCGLCAVRSHSGGLLLVAGVQRRGHDRHDAEPQQARPDFSSGVTLVVIYGIGRGYRDVRALFYAYTTWRDQCK